MPYIIHPPKGPENIYYCHSYKTATYTVSNTESVEQLTLPKISI